MNENELLGIVTKYFEEKIFDNHKINSLKNHSKLKSYKINPILVKYLSKVLEDDFTPIGIAKALYFPRDNSEEYFDYVFKLMLSIERYFKTEYYNNAK
jgi:hypothetical protein